MENSPPVYCFRWELQGRWHRQCRTGLLVNKSFRFQFHGLRFSVFSSQFLQPTHLAPLPSSLSSNLWPLTSDPQYTISPGPITNKNGHPRAVWAACYPVEEGVESVRGAEDERLSPLLALKCRRWPRTRLPRVFVFFRNVGDKDPLANAGGQTQ